MPSSLSAEARGLTKAAKAAEEASNIDQARALYLQAAGKFDEGSALYQISQIKLVTLPP